MQPQVQSPWKFFGNMERRYIKFIFQNVQFISKNF